MSVKILLLPIIIPLCGAIISFVLARRLRVAAGITAMGFTLFNFLVTLKLFGHSLSFSLPWAGFGLEFSLKVYHFNSLIIIATAGFGFLITLYSTVFMRGKERVGEFYAYFLLTIAFTAGAVLADNLVLLLFFWEGLLLTLFGLISIGRRGAFRTAIKAFIIVGISDLCMMVGIALTGHICGTLNISAIHLPLSGLADVAFILLVIGALAKGGSMPFHSWIPDASIDAPLPFMALVPAAFEKLLGIYFLTRICLDMFIFTPASGMSTMLMVVGAVTILLAVMMALIQKDYKKLLSYHAISQVGYMILGIGTAVPAGIIGGLFHMINNALYKSGLFLSAGAVEKEAGTTDLARLGGLGRKMPVTFGCFLVLALSISGVPPFNGFFSKELVYDGALERGLIFYLAALIGSFLTAASFLKLGHAAFLGKLNRENDNVKEVSWPMLFPMLTLAIFCIFFGLFNALPIDKLIQPVLGERLAEGHKFSGFPSNMLLVIATLVVLAAAFLNHLYGFKKKGSGLKAVDHIHYAPGLSQIYGWAEKGFFDPYNIGLKFSLLFSQIAFSCDRGIDWIYNIFVVGLAAAFGRILRRLHSGNYSTYLSWSLLGVVFVAIFLLLGV